MLRFFAFLQLVLLLAVTQVQAFVVEDIKVLGLERVAAGNVFEILPIRIGDNLQASQTKSIIANLYETGLFEDVSLKRQGRQLLIEVVERPGISSIDFYGNETITQEQLLEGLDLANIVIGAVFDRLALERLRQQLNEQYHAVGRYNARVTTQLEEIANNQVKIVITINEGEVAKIKGIKIHGNRKISDAKLLDEFELGTRSWYQFWSSKDDYSSIRLSGDLEKIKDLYQDRGYLDFEVTNTNISLSATKEDIFIDIYVSEGGRYRVGEIAISGLSLNNVRKLKKLVKFKKGEIFSRAKVVKSSEAIRYTLHDQGLTFAQINVIPNPNRGEGLVDVTFIINPGKKTYVRRINISGNEDTSDEVFRRELRQIEGAKYSISKVELSRNRLRRLPYVQNADIQSVPVEGVDNQVDLDVQVEERFSGNFSIGAGFSNETGAILNFSLNQENFLGTGNRVNFAFSNSDSDTNYTFGFSNPYYTIDGISRSNFISYRSVDYSERDVTDILSSASDQLRLRTDFGIPVSENDIFSFGGQFEKISTQLAPGAERRALQRSDINQVEIIQCIADEGGDFNNFSLNSSFNYDTRDRAVFATEGSRIRTSAQFYVPLSDSQYYKLDYSHRHYFPLDPEADYVLSLNGRLSYADSYGGSCVPYFDRYYLGGARDVRGYANNSLGPRDTTRRQRSVGGNFRTYGNVDLFFPTDFLYNREKLRMSAFLDFGNVYREVGDFDIGELRAAYGLQLQWLTALGGISLVFANAVNDSSDDQTEKFQFELGTNF